MHTLDEMQREYINDSKKCDTLEPAFNNQEEVTVCLASSDEYAPFAGVVIQSIICNASSKKNYDLVVLSDDMTVENCWRLEGIAKNHKNISIRIIDIAHIVSNFKFYTWAHFTTKTYYRMLVPDIFNTFDKVIYLDSDIVVNRDIADLYDIDIGDNLLGCCYDTHVVAYCTQKPPLEQREYNKTILKMENPEEYFQAGVSIYNVKQFREHYEKGYLINQGASLTLRWLDQDVINLLLKGKIFALPNKWNVMVANLLPDLDEYHLPEALRKEYFEARRNPCIVHYVGHAIPCYAKNPDLYEFFWKYARQTVFYEIILQRMCEEASKHSGYNNSEMQIVRQAVEELQLAYYVRTFKGRMRRISMPFINHFFPVGSRGRNRISLLHYRIRLTHSKPK